MMKSRVGSINVNKDLCDIEVVDSNYKGIDNDKIIEPIVYALVDYFNP